MFMKKAFGFSLAEALITLLIVSLIAAMTVPMMTKKTKKRAVNQPWSFSSRYNNALYPSENKDLMLGEISSGHPQSIIVVGRLEFKNRTGQTIGWIDEDGSSSFLQNSHSYANDVDYNTIMENQKRILSILNALQQVLQSGEINLGSSSNRIRNNHRKSRSFDDNSNNSNFNYNSTISEENLQRQIDDLIKNMNSNVYGR